MKRALLLMLGLSVAPAFASAQMTLNVGGGLSSATFVGDDAEPSPGEEKGSRTGIFAGANLMIPVAARFGVAPGVYYVQKGVKFSDSTGESQYKVGYLEIPLLLQAILSSGEGSIAVNIFAGPTISFEVGCDVEASSGGVTASADCDTAGLDERQSTDFGAVAGAGISFPVGERLSIGVSGGVDFGLRTLDSGDPAEDLKNRVIFGGVSVGIPIGG